MNPKSFVKAVANLLDKYEGVDDETLISDFISTNETSVYVTNNGELDDVMTVLNRLKPFSLNREFYRNHSVCYIHEDINLNSFRRVVTSSLYNNTHSVFVSNVGLKLGDGKTFKELMQNLSKELNVSIVVETQYGLRLSSSNGERCVVGV